MIRKTALLAMGVVAALGASASPITPEAALDRARGEAPAKARSLAAKNLRLVHTTMTKAGDPAAYVFTPKQGQGFTILSADDIAIPVLGYSDSGEFDPNNMPAPVKYWLNQYADQISYAAKHGATAYKAPATAAKYDPIAPLCKTKWNQDNPYNLNCPVIGSSKAPTGCVATSTAQVMKYFNYPEVGSGLLYYQNAGKTYSMVLKDNPFHWDKMLDVYNPGDYTQEQAEAVATLMQAVGYSVEMGYTSYASGAQSVLIREAMVDHFGYDKAMTYEDRMSYAPEVWEKKIYDNLKNVGPVIYNGTSPLDGGHSFVVDGYDGNGYFHLNWGWGGMSDGYYSLNVLTPMAQGLGGSMGGFNYSQDAVLGMQPDKGGVYPLKPIITQYGATLGKVSGDNVILSVDPDYANSGWINKVVYGTAKFAFGGILEAVDNTEFKPQEISGILNNTLTGVASVMTLKFGQYLSSNTWTLRVPMPKDLPDGKYKLYCASKDVTDGSTSGSFDKVDVPWGYPNYCFVTVNNGVLAVENVPAEVITYVEGSLQSELYEDRNVKLQVKMKNTYGNNLFASLSPVLLKNNQVVFKADSFIVEVNAGEEQTNDYVIKFTKGNNAGYVSGTEYTLGLLDNDRDQVVATFGNVTMTTLSGNTNVKLDELTIAGSELKESITVNGKEYYNVYVVPNLREFTVNFGYTVTRGYLDSNMMVGIFKRAEGTTQYTQVSDNIYSKEPFLGADQSAKVEIPVNFQEGEANVVYSIRAQWMANNGYRYLGGISILGESVGVESIIDDTNAKAEYFNLQGLRVDNPEKGMILIKKQAGKTQKVMF